MKILLIQLQPYKTTGDRVNPDFEPLSLCYVSAFLKQNGYSDVKILQREYSFDEDSFIKEVVSYQPDIVGFTSFTCVFNKVRKIAKRIRDEIPRIKTIWGGIHPSTDTTILNYPEVDYIVIGEAENTILHLLKYIETGSPDIVGIKGVAYRDGDIIKINPMAERITDLDSLPFPDRSGLSMDYYDISVETMGLKRAIVIASRGCRGTCSFCTAPYISGGKQYFRSPSNVVDEIAILKKDHNIELIAFGDEDLFTDRKWTKELMRELIERDVDIKFLCMGKISLLDDELIDLLKEAGCTRIHFGMEYHDREKREEMQKYISEEKIRKTIRALRKKGIFIQSSVILGFPWEDHASLEVCCQFVNTLDIDYLFIYFITPFPRTEFRRGLEEDNIPFEKNFDLYDLYHPIITMPSLSGEELVAWKKRILRRFYLSFHYFRIFLYRIFQSPGLLRNYFLLAKLAIRNRIFVR